MLNEFREFTSRGNVIDLAVGVIIGAAFTSIVNSLVNDIFMPLIGLVLGGLDFTGLDIQLGEAIVAYGKFLQAVVNFLIISSVVFLVMRAYNRLQRPKAEAPKEQPEEVRLLTEIRDLLKQR